MNTKSKENIWNNKNLVTILKNGGVVVMPTDTIYGLMGKAEDESGVSRIYAIRKRNPEKPCIILIGDIKELKKFSIIPTKEQKEKLKELWPGPVSIVLDCPGDSFSYLHRGTKTLAFRLPASPVLRDFMLQVGPLIAPSANPEGLPSAGNIENAKKYFGDSVDLYIDGGTIRNKASKLIRLHKDGTVNILRE